MLTLRGGAGGYVQSGRITVYGRLNACRDRVGVDVEL